MPELSRRKRLKSREASSAEPWHCAGTCRSEQRDARGHGHLRLRARAVRSALKVTNPSPPLELARPEASDPVADRRTLFIAAVMRYTSLRRARPSAIGGGAGWPGVSPGTADPRPVVGVKVEQLLIGPGAGLGDGRTGGIDPQTFEDPASESTAREGEERGRETRADGPRGSRRLDGPTAAIPLNADERPLGGAYDRSTRALNGVPRVTPP